MNFYIRSAAPVKWDNIHSTNANDRRIFRIAAATMGFYGTGVASGHRLLLQICAERHGTHGVASVAGIIDDAAAVWARIVAVIPTANPASVVTIVDPVGKP